MGTADFNAKDIQVGLLLDDCRGEEEELDALCAGMLSHSLCAACGRRTFS